MTDVLLLIWLADVASGAGSLLVATMLVCVFVAVGWTIFHATEKAVFPPPHFKKIVAGILAIGLVAALLPSRNLLLIAAGLRAGQEVVSTEIGQKAIRLLDKKLTRLLGGKE